jgi:hypothetical protein
MKKAMVVGLMLLASYGAGGGQGAETAGYQVTVHLQNPQMADPLLLAGAKALATSMFAGIGVHLRWEGSGRRRARGSQTEPDAEIMIGFDSNAPAGLPPDALACARPYAPQSDVRVTIFYYRVVKLVERDRFSDRAAFLGHVLAHEIGHVLQGAARHSEAGLMKAQFTLEDRAQMRRKPLPITDCDVELIRLGMPRHPGADITAQSRLVRGSGVIIPPAIDARPEAQ